MTKEEVVKEIEKAFEPAFANYIITALTEGATASDKEQGTAGIQAIYTEALEEGIRCAMCTNTMKSERGCDGGCVVDEKMYKKVLTEINSRLLRQSPQTEQENPMAGIDLDYVIKQKYIEREVLDKIRAEIEQLRLHKAQFLTNDNKVCIDSQEVLNILDKYKSESEVNNGTDSN